MNDSNNRYDLSAKRLVDTAKACLDAFSLNLKDAVVLTEAATGNYAVTPVMAAAAGATVHAIANDSHYGSQEQAIMAVEQLAERFNISAPITFHKTRSGIPLHKVDIITNTGFVRPIDKALIACLPPSAAVSLMWEPWEWRKEEVNLQACAEQGLIVYGTDESDVRVRTIEYLGFAVLRLLLENGFSPLSTKLALIKGVKTIYK